jgi:hypothetical protein
MSNESPIPKKKKPINSKAKGKGFEGEIAKTLSSKFAPYQFKRVLHSGAILGGKNVIDLGKYSAELANMFIGDVVCINESDHDKKFRFSIECKFYKTVETLDNFLGVTNSNIGKWYEESVVDAKKVNKEPLLIVKWNRSSIYCVTRDISLPSVDDMDHVYISQFKLNVFLFKEALIDEHWWFDHRIQNPPL